MFSLFPSEWNIAGSWYFVLGQGLVLASPTVHVIHCCFDAPVIKRKVSHYANGLQLGLHMTCPN